MLRLGHFVASLSINFEQAMKWLFLSVAEEKHAERLSEAKESKHLWYNPSMPWYIYILETQDSHFYTGTTNDIDRRMFEHKEGKGGHFTGSFKFKDLLYTEGHPDKSSALKRARQIQNWTRRKKLALIQGNFELLKKL